MRNIKEKEKEVPPVVHKNNPKIVSMVAYLTFVGWLIAYILNESKSDLSSFHLRQSLGIYLMSLVSGMLSFLPIFGWILSIPLFFYACALWFSGILTASREEKKGVPFWGDEFQKWFAGL